MPEQPKAMGGTIADLPRQSVFGQLRQTPRIYLLMGMMFISAGALGAKEVARFEFLDQTFRTEWGIGLSAAISSVFLASTSVIVGRLADRRDPRPFLLLALAIAASVNLAIALMLGAGPLPRWMIAISAATDGASLGLAGVSLLKIQASFVRPGAEGATEMLNILRLGLGGVVGAALAGLSTSPSLTLRGSAIVQVLVILGLWWTMRPVPPRPVTRASGAASSIFAYVRQEAFLRGLVLTDLALAFVMPTQLVNLVLFNFDAAEVASVGIAAAMAGILVGRLALVCFGFRGNPRVILLASVLALSAVQYLAAITLTGGWLIRQVLLLPAIVLIGTIALTYGQGLLAAIIQQVVGEQHRGSLAAVLVTGRSVLISVAAILSTLAVTLLGSQVLVGILATCLLLLTAATGGFAALASTAEESAPVPLERIE